MKSVSRNRTSHPEIMDLADKDFKVVIIYNICILKDFKENMSIMRREMEGIKKRNI